MAASGSHRRPAPTVASGRAALIPLVGPSQCLRPGRPGPAGDLRPWSIFSPSAAAACGFGLLTRATASRGATSALAALCFGQRSDPLWQGWTEQAAHHEAPGALLAEAQPRRAAIQARHRWGLPRHDHCRRAPARHRRVQSGKKKGGNIQRGISTAALWPKREGGGLDIGPTVIGVRTQSTSKS